MYTIAIAYADVYNNTRQKRGEEFEEKILTLMESSGDRIEVLKMKCTRSGKLA